MVHKIDCLLFTVALAFLLHSVGAKLILAGRNVHKLKQIQFTLDSDSHTQVC